MSEVQYLDMSTPATDYGFEYITTGKFSRSGVLKTRRGSVKTPTFMPDATRGAVKGLTPDQVKGTGVGIVLNNTYHLHLQPGEKTIAKLGGVHEFSHWPGPILTDSGGFQVFSLAKHTKVSEEGVAFQDPVSGDNHLLTPELSIQIQFQLGSDMLVAFDHLIGLGQPSPAKTLAAFERTHRWLERCIKEFNQLNKALPAKDKRRLFGVVQGGLDKKLRRKSLDLVQNSSVDGIAIGGLSVGETQAEMFRVLADLAPLYDPARPRFLLGVGPPADLRFALEHGIDMADCVLPTRNARHATVWVENDRQIHLTNAQYSNDPKPIMTDCDCYTCLEGYSKAFLRHQFKVNDPLAGSLASIHNLRYLTRLCESFRQ